jgi:membrane protein
MNPERSSDRSPDGPAWQRAWQRLLRMPVLGVLVLAVRNYVLHQSANQAGSLAFSAVLAMFPLLILLSATAGYVGEAGNAAALAARVMSYSPQLVRDAMQPVIEQVLAQRNQALLAVGMVATVWTASSGMQAVRSALTGPTAFSAAFRSGGRASSRRFSRWWSARVSSSPSVP